jgi:hypothetical protein
LTGANCSNVFNVVVLLSHDVSCSECTRWYGIFMYFFPLDLAAFNAFSMAAQLSFVMKVLPSKITIHSNPLSFPSVMPTLRPSFCAVK